MGKKRRIRERRKLQKTVQAKGGKRRDNEVGKEKGNEIRKRKKRETERRNVWKIMM